MGEKIWFLKNCALFEQLEADQLAELESHCLSRKFSRNSPIYPATDHADAVLLLASGRVAICNITHDGRKAILAFVEPGELFGELALFAPRDDDEYAEAVEASTIVLIPRQEMNRLMEQHAEVAFGITKLMGLRRQRIERRLKYLLFRSNRERLIHLLLELAEQYGKQVPEGVLLGIKLSHQELASIIGSTRETVTVVLGELQDEGKLQLGRRRIVLIRPQALADSVHRPLSLAGA